MRYFVNTFPEVHVRVFCFMDESCFNRGTYSTPLKVVEQVSVWLPYHAFHTIQCDVAVKKTLV
jgi:hypothetical protein